MTGVQYSEIKTDEVSVIGIALTVLSLLASPNMHILRGHKSLKLFGSLYHMAPAMILHAVVTLDVLYARQ